MAKVKKLTGGTVVKNVIGYDLSKLILDHLERF